MRYAMTAMAVIVFAANLACAADEKKNIPAGLPGDAKWDMSELERSWVIVKSSYDPDTREVSWVLEAKTEAGRPNWYFKFYDADDVKLERSFLEFKPDSGIVKGQRVHGTLKLPKVAIIKEAKKAVCTSQG